MQPHCFWYLKVWSLSFVCYFIRILFGFHSSRWMQIVIVSNEEEKKEFIREVGEEVLPEEYGGKAKLVAIQDVQLPPLQNGSEN